MMAMTTSSSTSVKPLRKNGDMTVGAPECATPRVLLFCLATASKRIAALVRVPNSHEFGYGAVVLKQPVKDVLRLACAKHAQRRNDERMLPLGKHGCS